MPPTYCDRLRPRALAGLGLSLVLVAGLPAAAQDDARAKELEALRSTVQNLEQALQDVRARLAELEAQRAPAAPTPTPAPAIAPAATPALAAPAPTAVGANVLRVAEMTIDLPPPPAALTGLPPSFIPDYDMFGDYQEAAPRPENRPINPALKGFLTIPGTETMIRFGGSARLDAIYDFEDNGNPNQFVPSSIPVEGQPGAEGGSRSTLHAKGTRITFEARRAVGESGQLRIYNENDFFDDSASGSMKFRVRHFYGQVWDLLIGQTFTAFMNIDAWPDVVDYAGPNAIINRRQPQFRWSPTIHEGRNKEAGAMHLIFSVEQPDSDLSVTAAGVPPDAEPVNRLPDGVVGWRWEGGLGHVQLAGLFRSVGYEAEDAPDDTVFGWGASASGAFNLFAADKLAWQAAYGEGMARYVNDLGGGKLDAAPDSSGELEALPVFAVMAGYTHQWSGKFRSTASYGYIHVDPAASLGASAVEHTQYASLNLVWQPTTSFRMGLEYLYGSKDVQSGADGDAHRINFVLRYDLIR